MNKLEFQNQNIRTHYSDMSVMLQDSRLSQTPDEQTQLSIINSEDLLTK